MPKYDAISHLHNMSPAHIENLFDLKGKICVVTGGSRGIGLMICKAYVENGATVYVSSRKASACDRVASELTSIGPGVAISMPADVSTDKGCKVLVEKIARRENHINVLVNNAGITWGAPFEEFPENQWSRIMTLNVASVFNMTRACTPLLSKGSKGNLEPSHVINITSVAGDPSSAPENDIAPSYSASKAAANKLTRTLAGYLNKYNICVNAIAPAVFPSRMTHDFMLSDEDRSAMTAKTHPVGRVGNEQDMAGAALFLASKASAFVTGSVLNLDGGSVAIRPMIHSRL